MKLCTRCKITKELDKFGLSKLNSTKVEDQKKLCCYTNLRPMWFSDNVRKSNKTEEIKNKCRLT